MTTIQLSYNEVQSLALKAARGAGLPQGIAEEIGTAVVWLSSRGVDALSHLVEALATPQVILVTLAMVDAVCSGERTGMRLAESDVLLLGLAGASGCLAMKSEEGRTIRLSRIADGASPPPCATMLRGVPDPADPANAATARPAATDTKAYAAALALAARTYVPASDLSRDRGAGAGTTDND
ncbi:Protein of unknown function [Rhizobium sp. RU20A]|uniref:DUF3726 domain-containing protein n=1 Tax=Rhizobium sp. RU20A TaxID=1907412 RepID=UPI0009547169|nr:DUF3726 domain-containing protein [Rhizobium sp. RU20A]SIR24374.1 Protein of unknown function [Rhizobium sp. RU20A]